MKRVDPKSIVEALFAWDNGDEVRTVEMGGLGDGYENAIQTGVFELVRLLQYDANLRKAETERTDDGDYTETFKGALDTALGGIDRRFGLGLSGAQWGAIKNLAIIYNRRGWEATNDEQVADRIIYVRKQDAPAPADNA